MLSYQYVKKLIVILFFSFFFINHVVAKTSQQHAEINRESEKVQLDIVGIKDRKLLENIHLYLSTLDKEEADGSDRYQYLVSVTIDKALRAMGYYDTQIKFSFHQELKKLIAYIKLNKPIRIVKAQVHIVGEATINPVFDILDKKLPHVGDILNHGNYNDFKSSIQKLAIGQGYFDGKFTLHRLEVIPSLHQANWLLRYDSGQRYHYGKITLRDNQIREDYIRNIIKITPDQPYLINDLSLLTADLSSSNWYQSVMVEPEIDTKHKRVDLNIFFTPLKKNAVELSVGYASDVGPRLQVGWSRPWINSRGHSIKTNLYLSEPRQAFESVYRLPLLKNPLLYYYEFSTGVENEKKNDTRSLATTFAGLRYWNHPTGWQYSLGLRLRYDDFEQADIKRHTLLAYPTTSITRTRLRGGLFPEWGDSQRLTIDVGRKQWFSDVNFFSIRGTTSWIRTYAKNHRIYTRLELGWLKTAQLERMPPALRFFAGGDRSVRGYGYKKISPKDADGKLEGGSHLATGTLEYQYQFVDNWWFALFGDAGLAASRFNYKELHYGVGTGIRWASPVGAVKFDIATPIDNKYESNKRYPIQIYIGLGTEL